MQLAICIIYLNILHDYMYIIREHIEGQTGLFKVFKFPALCSIRVMSDSVSETCLKLDSNL